MKQYSIIILLFLLAADCAAKESKSAKKNRKIIAKEEQHFQKAIRKNTDTAVTYFNHANNLAVINSESARAMDYYLLALKYDSANAGIYKNFGKYLFDKKGAFSDSKNMLVKGLAIAANDEEMKKY